ncbi:UNVERIFIED_CONTAM: hypothetical protein PYX00_008944 [Menopon gallinae]|uniref:Phospholipid/glycerol acyltransferase domain-containing protein n=1 Tax=Menopon gallinae TaxID=328185 RepID=A0AAW2H9I8_9NEOP
MDFIQGLKQSRICHLLLAVTFLTSGLIINILQCVLYYGLRPFNKYLFRKIIYYVNYSLYCQVIFIAQYWGNAKFTLHVKKSDFDKYFGKEHGYLIMNHTYEIDWVIGWILCDNVRILGNAKSYAKKAIQYLPTLGWAWKFSESVFLERNWEKDKGNIKRQINELVSYPDPMWLLLTAEGTRFTENKYNLSKKFAEQNGLPILKHHLSPRTKGFTTSLPYLRKNVAIYNVILGFKRNGVKPTMMSLLMGKNVEANMYVERIPITEVPEDEDESAKWLHQLYERKDKMLDSFLETGSWFETSGVEKVEGFLLRRRIYPLLNTAAWGLITLPIVTYYMFKLFTSGSIVYFCIACALIATFTIFFQSLVGQTEISKGSSYGAR